ncbi:hypothetical protein RHMOL_Rhmol03G0160700 [Rhododendron molle]|uniref:Uncharacterized protein n=1 Tax=Rhododendron molle TaxID=49168 RepID=A0ACC0PH96_RHOML|nr:hypothetical protein RHMOL_Rhmol03G0160700 [Rhododendron molle]
MSASRSQPQSQSPLPDPTGVAMEDGEQAQGVHHHLQQEAELNLGSPVRSTVPPLSPTELGEFSPKSATKTSPSTNLQQDFEQALAREAEERATASPFTCHQEQVQVSTSNPKILFNTEGNPYVEGDPNLGYSVEDTLSRAGNRATGSQQTVTDFKPSSSTHYVKPHTKRHQESTHVSVSSLSVTEVSKGIPRELAEVSVEKDPVLHDHSIQEVSQPLLSIPTTSTLQQCCVSSPGEEVDSEEELLEVLELVVSSSREVEHVPPVKDAVSLDPVIKTAPQAGLSSKKSAPISDKVEDVPLRKGRSLQQPLLVRQIEQQLGWSKQLAQS